MVDNVFGAAGRIFGIVDLISAGHTPDLLGVAAANSTQAKAFAAADRGACGGQALDSGARRLHAQPFPARLNSQRCAGEGLGASEEVASSRVSCRPPMPYF
jgi:hypothetical protein